MKPISLRLNGFSGIKSGSGKDSISIDLSSIPEEAKLVALVGPNGTGKTTIMDNLHPYRVMPSRSSTLGPGGFSFWDNICNPTAEKDLVWEHGGRKYRSLLSFKLSGKTKKADCYLFLWNDGLHDWTPVTLNDGTLSDGKSDTYDRCIESILGRPEAFFTSHFSAQGKKSISDYGASDIKNILASILNLNHLRDLSAKAAMVGKLIKFKLDGLQDQISQSRGADSGIESANDELMKLEETAKSGQTAEQQSLLVLDESRKALSILEAQRDSLAKNAEEAVFLNEQISQATKNAEVQKTKVSEQAKQDTQRLAQEKSKAEADVKGHRQAIVSNETEHKKLTEVLVKRDDIDQASKQLPEFRAAVEAIDTKIQEHQAKLVELAPVRVSLQNTARKLTELKVDGEAKARAVGLLDKTASLITEVPCTAHENLQSKCPLLSQANEAKQLLPGEQKVLLDKRMQYQLIQKEHHALEESVSQISLIEQAVAGLNEQRRAATLKVDVSMQLAALMPLVKDADDKMPALATAKDQLLQKVQQDDETIAACAKKIDEINAAASVAIDAINVQTAEAVQVLSKRLAQLESPVTVDQINAAKSKVQSASDGVEAARATLLTYSNQRVQVLSKIEAFKSIKQKTEEAVLQADQLSNEIAKWKLIEKGMGRDGLVALSIDDAGPEISMLCNSLLNECYDGRFSVRLDTQRATQEGNLKETFEVMVFDNHRGEDKLLDAMSGGEKVWVNECLIRSIALYVGQSNEVQCLTLFSDESDGPLDPERKRQFMQMKRAVQERGGYSREYFISQTPELWEAADHIIDVALL